MKIEHTPYLVILLKKCFGMFINYKILVIIAATEDKSWKVRLALAKNFAGVYTY